MLRSTGNSSPANIANKANPSPLDGKPAASRRSKLVKAKSRIFNIRKGFHADSESTMFYYRKRSRLLHRRNYWTAWYIRVQVTDCAILCALFGFVVTVVDSELTSVEHFGINKRHKFSLMLRCFTVASTLLLDFLICAYHANEIALAKLSTEGDYLLVIKAKRIIQLVVELIVCTICPLPGSAVPIDVVLSVLMILRAYLFTRFMVFHSHQFQQGSTRALAALNKVPVNFSFVLKTKIDDHPVAFLSLFSFVFLISMGWCFTQCERFYFVDHADRSVNHYLNSMWFLFSTFILNGYGDIVPRTMVGRLIAVFVAVVGAAVSSLLVAIAAHRIIQSAPQRNVNAFLRENHITMQLRNDAATVIQHAFRLYFSRDVNWRLHTKRKRFLDAIERFREAKEERRQFYEKEEFDSRQLIRIVRELSGSIRELSKENAKIKEKLEELVNVSKENAAQKKAPSEKVPKRK